MAIFFDAPVPPDALTAFVREVPTPAGLQLLNRFPVRTHDDNRVNFSEIVRTNRTAKYRSFDGRVHVSSRDTGSDKYVGLAPVSSSLTMGEYERLQLEFARVGGTNQAALARAVYNDGENLVREILNRWELAWGDTLTDGILTISEGGFAGVADYGVPANHKVTVGSVWTTPASSTVLSDIVALVDVYVATNGFGPGSMMTSQKNQRLMQRSAEVINAIAGSAAGRSRVRASELQDLLETENLPRLEQQPYDTVVDVDGVSTRTIPDDKVIFFPPNIEDLGHLAVGVSATALELVNDNRSAMTFEEAMGIVGVVDKGDGPPYREQTFVDAVGQPVLDNGRLLAVLDVA